MKRNYLTIAMLFLFTVTLSSCNKDDDSKGEGETTDELVGQDGNPRFNLQFTNPENVDLDLYVQTPSGAIIFYGNLSADQGTLDVDCLCEDCPQGPNENIFWENGTAPSGTYKFWVDYFGACNEDGASSNFTLRVVRNGVVLQTKTGTMNAEGTTQQWTFEHEN
ncbi:uncharacterized protein YfaP (DUF2135 family) [Flavobacterium arsenatis]|uniref:Uncharacterized protein YfaP (DUF2135 family) n=1 Tax=Flavobacterium arsenatis TaxID=1484332 RepID=A0ABU1TU33_9FLAO|nr:hypothetical protein [Flavobacterium arsenatis]MDR6969351.1 uncharacterized protein YfaP (DUF2135 family) [Flavobacterium arsenatis]